MKLLVEVVGGRPFEAPMDWIPELNIFKVFDAQTHPQIQIAQVPKQTKHEEMV